MAEQLILDRYRLIERIATGGSAEVWRAHDEQLDRPVAVKRLHPHLLPDETARQRLASEARAAARLSHPAVVSVYDVDVGGEWPALVMEFVDGESLGARIVRAGPMAADAVASIGADLADALYHAHQRGVIHRDVKPGNVLLDGEGRAHLVDFGIARSLGEAASQLTQTGTVVGTLTAMAPEQLAGGDITPRTDLYGLGVVLHHALVGRPPYESTSPVALAEAQRTGPPPMGTTDPGLAAVTRACLAHRVEDRPIHAGAVATALRAWLNGDSGPALALASGPAAAPAADAATTAVSPAVPAAPAQVAAGAHVAEAAAAVPAPSRRPAAVAAFVAGALIVLVVVAMLALGGGLLSTATDPSTSPPSSPTSDAPSSAVPSSAAPTPTAAPPSVLTGWQRQLAAVYREQCGAELDMALIAGMNKKEAEDRVEELMEDCH